MVRPLIAASLTFLLASRGASAEKRVALVIGNSNYALAPLTNPKNDVDDVAAALKRLNFEVTKGIDLAIAQFDQTVDDFAAAATNARFETAIWRRYRPGQRRRDLTAVPGLRSRGGSPLLASVTASMWLSMRASMRSRRSIWKGVTTRH
jgi:hypothetical protein